LEFREGGRYGKEDESGYDLVKSSVSVLSERGVEKCKRDVRNWQELSFD